MKENCWNRRLDMRKILVQQVRFKLRFIRKIYTLCSWILIVKLKRQKSFTFSRFYNGKTFRYINIKHQVNWQ